MIEAEQVADVLAESANALARLAGSTAACEQVAALAQAIVDSVRGGGTVWLFGNGGSAADAQHLAAELVGRFQRERRAFPAVALTTDTSVLSALANDYGYETVFARQVDALTRPGDVVIGISTSGRSPSVLDGLVRAHERGAKAFLLTGETPADTPATCVLAPVAGTARIQECHTAMGHALAQLVESALAPADA